MSGPLEELKDKIRLHRSVFEIHYILRLRKLVLDLLVEAGLPKEVVIRHLLPFVIPYLPYFDPFRCIVHTYMESRLNTYLCTSPYVYIEFRKKDNFQIGGVLMVADNPPFILPDFTAGDEALISSIIHYCYCYYQLGDTSLLEKPDILGQLPTCKKMKEESGGQMVAVYNGGSS